jgi:serine/threonine-protein kinase
LVGVELEGGYRVEGLIGQGGMGAVYRATHMRLEKPVAVKVLAHQLTGSAEYLSRFRREAMVTGGLGHPHIVQVFDLSTTPTGEPFLVMELLEGEDLDRRLSRVRRLSPADTVHVVKQIAGALAATHAKGIVHRDLKPANVFLMEVAGEENFVKVLDFGISKMRSASAKLTRTSSVMGTPNYMSPEQAQGKVAEIDERTDQWALGCIAWECLTGRRPFDGEESTSILYQVVYEQPTAPDLAPEVQAVLLRALAKSKSERFASVSEFAVALERVVTGVSGAAVPRTRVMPDAQKPRTQTTFSRTTGELTEPDRPVASTNRWWPLVTGIALVLLVAGFFVLRPRPVAPVNPNAANPPVVDSRPAPAPPAPAPTPAPAPGASPTPAPAPAPPVAIEPAADTPPAAAKKPPKAQKRKVEGTPSPSPPDKSASKTKPSKENQDQWLVE